MEQERNRGAGDTALWLWAQNAFGEGSRLPWHIHKSYPGGLEGFYRAGPSGWRELNYITPKQFEALSAFGLQEAQYKLHYAQQMGWDVLTPESEKYPGALRNISDPPAVLYVQGDLSPLADHPWVAVVGARKAGKAGAAMGKRIAYELASAGAVVVTGVARGIDSAALEGAMAAMCPAVSVLPVDLATVYKSDPNGIRDRQRSMGGALISEYFSQLRPLLGAFQQRNRLITGMCQAVVVVQAGESGGSLIYARHAAKQGRGLFVCPPPPEDPAFAGNRMLLANGAQLLDNGWELFEKWPELFRSQPPLERELPKRTTQGRSKPKPRPTPAEEPHGQGLRMILRDAGAAQVGASAYIGFPPGSALVEDGLGGVEGPEPAPAEGPAPAEPAPVPKSPTVPEGSEGVVLASLQEAGRTLEELSEQTGLGVGQMLPLLSRLELEGRVRRGPGGRYCLS